MATRYTHEVTYWIHLFGAFELNVPRTFRTTSEAEARKHVAAIDAKAGTRVKAPGGTFEYIHGATYRAI